MIKRLLILASLVVVPIVGTTTEAQAEEYCREYNKTVSINGRSERAYGTACRQNDGSWEIVSLEGAEHARDKVRDTMYDDIEKYEDRHNHDNYRHASQNQNARIVIVDNHHYSRPYYSGRYKHYDRYNQRANHRYHAASYSHWPFVINVGNYGSKKYSHNRKRSYKNHKYSGKSYNRRRY